MRAAAELIVDSGAVDAGAGAADAVGPDKADSGGGVPRLRWRSAPPVVLRRTGPRQVHLVQAAGGPLGGDDLALRVRVDAATCLQVRSAGASVVQSGPAPARWSLTADVADGAVLDWRPQPTVVCDGAELHSSVRVRLRPAAGAVLREEVVLGRAGQSGGRYRGALAVDLGGAPVLMHELVLDGADAALSGPAGSGGARVVGTLVVVGERLAGPAEGAGEEPGLRWACSTLDGPGRMLIALGDTVPVVAGLLDRAAAQVRFPVAPDDHETAPE